MLVKLKPRELMPSPVCSTLAPLRQIMKTSMIFATICGFWNNFKSWSRYFAFLLSRRGNYHSQLLLHCYRLTVTCFFPPCSPIRDHSDHLASKWNIYMRWLYILLVSLLLNIDLNSYIRTWWHGKKNNESPFEKYNSNTDTRKWKIAVTCLKLHHKS